MSFIKKVLGIQAEKLITSVGTVIDNITVDDSERMMAKESIASMVLENLNTSQAITSEIVKTEMQGNWLQKSWRPVVMLIFTALLVVRWTGLAQYEIDKDLEMKLMEIIELGLGGYVIGRSVEKISSEVVRNVDLPFLKKKDRASYLDERG